jgi:cytochrome b561
MWKNTEIKYGTITKILHWLSALTIFGLFALGLWMVTFEYDSPWYHSAPMWHKSIGILLFIIIIFRLLWRFVNITPKPLKSHSALVIKASSIAHVLLYLLVLTVLICGYLIAATDGNAITVFNLFTVPATGELIEQQEDVFGEIHEITAYILVILATLHGLAAIKHHVIDKDSTLTRMLK